jgi:hypothetical protein
MSLTDQDRKLIRLAYATKDPELRRRAVTHLKDREAIDYGFGGGFGGGLGWAEDAAREQRQKKEEKATYEAFLKEVEGKKFRNPDTGNQVLFVSLPDAEQKKVYGQWKAYQAVQSDKKKKDSEGTRKKLREKYDWKKGEEYEDRKKRHRETAKETGTYEQARTLHDHLHDIAEEEIERKHGKDADFWKRNGITGVAEGIERLINSDNWEDLEMVMGGDEEAIKRLGQSIEGYQSSPHDPKEIVRQLTMAQERMQSETPDKKKQRLKSRGERDDKRRSDREKSQKEEAERKRKRELAEQRQKEEEKRRREQRKKDQEERDKRYREEWDRRQEEKRKKEQEEAKGWEEHLKAAASTPFARRMVRVAYTTSDPVLRRGILESIRVAGYPKEFLEAVKQQKFRNPVTNNQVKFVSLPGQMQAQIYSQWKQKQQDGETGLEGIAPGPEEMTAAQEAVAEFMPERVDSLEDAKKLHEAGKPWRMSAVAGSAYKGKFKFWEVRGDGDKIEIRFGGNYQGAAKPQVKELQGGVDQAWKRFQQKLKKGYDSGIGPNWAMSFSGGPMGMDADKLWKSLEDKHGDDPQKMAEVVKATLQRLTSLDAWSPGNWQSVHDATDGLVDKWKEYQAKGISDADKPEAEVVKEDKPEKKPKGPQMVDMTSEVMQGLKDMGQQFKDKAEQAKKDKKKPKKPKKPTFSQARDAAFGALEDAGWKVKKGLKIPKAEREIDGNKVVLSFKPQAVYMEVKGVSSHPLSLHVDLRDVDPKEWEATLADEAKKMIGLEQGMADPEPPKEPKKTEAPEPPKTPEKVKVPEGKHKDRKELRSKPKKKMSDKVKVGDDLAAMLIPDGMPDKQKAQAKKQLEGASFQLLASLRDNAQHAVDDPKGPYAQALMQHGYTADGIKKMHTALSKALTPALGKKYHPDVLSVANKHDLESEDADELAAFKGDKPSRGKKLTPQELFNKFKAKASPETKERMQGMPLDDFMAMYNAIMSDEDEEIDAGTGKGKAASRLPEEPHTVMQDAIEEGRLAEDDNDVMAGEDEDAGGLTIFDAPTTVKKARMSEEDRRLVRLAHGTSNPDLRRRILGMLKKTA